jgi:hypothetical protein
MSIGYLLNRAHLQEKISYNPGINTFLEIIAYFPGVKSPIFLPGGLCSHLKTLPELDIAIVTRVI